MMFVLDGDDVSQGLVDVSRRHRILDVTGNLVEMVGENMINDAAGSMTVMAGTDCMIESGTTTHIKALAAKVEASTGIELVCGGSSIVLTPGAIFIAGPIVNINTGSGPPVSPVVAPTTAVFSPAAPVAPVEPAAAAADHAGQVGDTQASPAEPSSTQLSDSAVALRQAAEDGAPFCEVCQQAAQDEADAAGGGTSDSGGTSDGSGTSDSGGTSAGGGTSGGGS